MEQRIQKFEYLIKDISIYSTSEFNRYGKEGWELVTTHTSGYTTHFIFKRPIIEDNNKNGTSWT